MQNPLLPPTAGAAGVERQLLPDRTVDDADDPDLGAAAMEDAIMGEGDEAGGARLGASFKDWPDNDEVELAPHRQLAPNH